MSENAPLTTWCELPAEAYPFTIDFILERTGETVWTVTVAGPGVLQMPALAGHGPFRARIAWPGGRVTSQRSHDVRRD